MDDSIKRSREGVRAVALALLVLGVAALAQAILFLASGSVALLADLIHNAGDALLSGELSVRDLPEAWNAGMEQRLGIRPSNDTEGVLQDTHWGAGLIGYFPTYSIGNLMASQLWERVEADLPEVW